MSSLGEWAFAIICTAAHMSCALKVLSRDPWLVDVVDVPEVLTVARNKNI